MLLLSIYLVYKNTSNSVAVGNFLSPYGVIWF